MGTEELKRHGELENAPKPIILNNTPLKSSKFGGVFYFTIYY